MSRCYVCYHALWIWISMKPSRQIEIFKTGVYEQQLKAAWCCTRNGFPPRCFLSGTRSCSCSSPATLNLLRRLMLVTLAGAKNAFESCFAHFSSPWHHQTGWMRTACCSGRDLRVTPAALRRSAWVKRTGQVRVNACQQCVLWAGARIGDGGGGLSAARHTGHIHGDPSRYVCNKRRLCW